MDDPVSEAYLEPTPIIDSDHSSVREYAEKTAKGVKDPVESAVKLYYGVRDGIWYDPYYPFYRPEHYRASNILKSGRGYCVCKASLLCALGRSRGIPSRLGFADVRNHLATRQLLAFLGSDLFVYHGFVEFFLEGRWVKATPAFNKELCRRHRVSPLEFNGHEDSLFQPYNLDKRQFMEYVADHGTFADVPVQDIIEAWERAYGRKRVREWITLHEQAGGESIRDFYQEQVWKKGDPAPDDP
jgi:transglutaminase-like putative cysteine protease